jgi:hypothetical protein
MQKRAGSQAQKTSISRSIDTRNDINAALLAEKIAKKKCKSISSIPLEVSINNQQLHQQIHQQLHQQPPVTKSTSN